MELVLDNLRLRCIEGNVLYGCVDALFDGGEYVLTFTYSCDEGAVIDNCRNINTGAYSINGANLFGDYNESITETAINFIECNLCCNPAEYRTELKPE